MKGIYPKNKGHFERLIPFAKRIILLCKEVGAEPVVYGSFAHFYHTKDKTMNVNDIDLMIPNHKKTFPKIVSILKKNKIIFEYYPEWETMIIKKGKLRVEIDSVGLGNESFNEDNLFTREHDLANFYGLQIKIFKFEHLEKSYIKAYLRSTDNKDKILDKMNRLENFLGRKLKNPISIEIIKTRSLSKTQKGIINKARIIEFGNDEEKDFSKDYEPETLWFFVKAKNKIVSLGGLRPITAEYLGKKYTIGGICSVVSVIKGKGYGKILMSFMKNYSYKTGKTILGFTGDKNIEIFKKTGLEVEKDFIKRFVYKKQNGELVYDDDGNGIYYEGRDKFITKVLKGKHPVYINVLHW